MEELRSTEILDKEIIADSKRKAERIQKNSVLECEKILSSVEQNVNDAVEKTREILSKKLAQVEADLNAAVPLEKQRFFVSFVESAIIESINLYLDNLSEDKKIQIALTNLPKIKETGHKFIAYTYGFDESKVKKVVSDVLGQSLEKVSKTEFNKIIYEDSFLKKNQGVILISDDETIKCRFTLCEIFSEILEKSRQELSENLFGKENIEKGAQEND